MKKERKDWCKLPYKVLLDDRLTPADAVLYAVLADLANLPSKEGDITIKIANLSELTGLSPATVKRCLEHLKNAGYVISKKTDGRKLIIAIEQVISSPAPKSEQEQAEEPKPKKTNNKTQEPTDEERKAALIGMLVNKYPYLPLDQIHGIYNSLKSEALARIKDKSKLYSYLATAVKNLEFKDNSDGFCSDEYDIFWNNF